jgi:hypothetical protein
MHSASDCLRNMTFYGRETGESSRVLLPTLRPELTVSDGRTSNLTGAFFDSHPVLQNAACLIPSSWRACVTSRVCTCASHPSTSMLPAQWHVQDEMLAANPMDRQQHFRDLLKSPFAGTISNQIPGRSAPLWSFQPTGLLTRVPPDFSVASSRYLSDTRSQTLALISSIRGHHTQ